MQDDSLCWRDREISEERDSEHRRNVKNQAEKPKKINFSGHNVDHMHFVVLQGLGSEGTGSW